MVNPSSRPFTVTVVLSVGPQTGGGYHQALTSLRMLVERFPPHFRLRVLDEKNTFGEALKALGREGLLDPENITSLPRRMPTFRDRVVVEDGLFYRFARWLLALRGVSVGSSPLARFLDNSDTDLVYFVTPTTAAHELQIKPFVWTLWDLCHLDSPEFPEVRTSGKFEAREATISQNLRKAALVIVDSPELEDNARRSYGITADKFVTIPFSPPMGIGKSPANGVQLPPRSKILRANTSSIRRNCGRIRITVELPRPSHSSQTRVTIFMRFLWAKITVLEQASAEASRRWEWKTESISWDMSKTRLFRSSIEHHWAL